METQVKNRGWVKNAAIIFLAVLLVLTFFSNTFMNRSLTEVATQSVESGSITARVRGTGTVTATGAYELKSESTRKIQSVMVKAGQEVNQGDVLFVLGEGASEEQEAAAEELRQLQLNYQQTAVGIPSFDYTLQENEVATAEEDYKAAVAATADALKRLQIQIGEAKLTDANYEDKLKAAETELNNAKAALEQAKVNASSRKDAQKQEVQEKEIWETVLDYAQTVLTQYIADNTIITPPAGEQNNSEEGNSEQENSNQGEGGQGTDQEAGEAGQPAEETSSPATTAAPIPAKSVDDLKMPYNEDTLTEDEKKIYDKKLGDLATLLQGATTATEQQSKITTAMTTAKWELQNAQNELASTDPEVTKAEDEVAKKQAELDRLLNLLGPYADEYKAAAEAEKTALNRWETLKYNLEETKRSNNRSAAGSAITLQDLNYRIDQAKKKLADLSGGEENTIVAPVGGIIDSIGFTAGNTAPKGEILCMIQVPDLGYTLSFSVTNDQARRLKTGDTASVTNYYWGSQIDATLTSIRTDPKAPQTNKLLTFDVTGDVNPGSELTIAVGSKSQNYDLIVPNSSIRTDANGSFVLAIEAKNSPLGNRYYARRVEVTVLAQDDVNSAVTADLSYGDFVITTSNRPVQPGDMVRMPD